MRQGDYYLHFKGNEYYFCGVALPLSEFTGKKSELMKINLAYDAHTPDGEEIIRVQLFVYHGMMLIDRETPHVVYQAQKDYDTDKVWVREVDDFFGYKDDNGKLIKRFTMLNK